jgi:hypothetical protein
MATELGGVSPGTTDQDLETGGAPDADERRRFARAVSRIRWRECAAPAAGTVFVTLIAGWYFQIRNGGLGTPITYREDALYYASITKSIIDHGWYLKDLSLGAPLGRFAYDYPLGSDNLNLAVIRGLTWLSSNPFVVNNVFLLLTFPAAFLASWFVFRRLGFSKSVAWVAGVVYAILPYHFWRADPHLLLSAYYVVPLGALLLYEFIGLPSRAEHNSWRELTAGSWRDRGLRLLRSRWLWIPVILGSGGVYYAAFFGFLAIAAGCLTALRDRDVRRIALPAICSVIVVVVLLINNAPTLIYSARHGPNEVVADRQLGENDRYGLGISYLVLPVNNHRLPLFRHVKETLTNESVTPVPDSENQALGLLASLGLVVSVGSVLMGFRRRPSDDWSEFRRASGELNLLAILLATFGGISTIVGLIGFTSLRGYNRISVFIAFFSLVALGALCESWLARRKLVGRRGIRFTAGAVALSLAVCAFAVFDQTPKSITFPGQPDRDQVKDQLASDRAFAESIERRLSRGSMVFELPLLEYPEAGVQLSPPLRTYYTDELSKPSLLTNGLRWSWGAMKGRPEDLTPSFVGRPVAQLLPDLAAIGYDGIYIDRRGFADHGTWLEAELNTLLDGQRPMVSRNGDLAFFDLRSYRRTYAAAIAESDLRAQRTSALHPLRLSWGAGFVSTSGSGAFYPALDGVTLSRGTQNGAALEVTNPLRKERHLMLHFGANAADMQPATLEVRTPRGTQRFDLPSTTPHTLDVEVPPGETRLTFRINRTVRANPTDPDFQIIDPWWETPPVVARLGT